MSIVGIVYDNKRFGSSSDSSGNAVTRMSESSRIIKNGQMPLIISAIDALVVDERANSVRPTGGVIVAICIFTITMMA